MGMGGSHHLSISEAQDLQLMVAGIISHLAPIVVILNEAGR
jgi:hypothetical protein